MEIPKHTESHRRLERLAGDWMGEELLFPSPWDPKGGPAVSRLTAHMGLDGFFLVTDYVQERDGRISYRGHGLYGWDAQKGVYTMHWFDSMGSGPGQGARGTWEGNRLTFEMQSPMGHGRYIYELEGEGRLLFRIEHSPDGQQWAPFMEARFTKA